MIYKNAQLMIKGITGSLEDGDVVVRADDRAQLLVGFRVDRPGTEAHAVTLMSLKSRHGITEDIEDLIVSGAGRDRMARAMTHRHGFKGHGCAECSVYEVMEA